MKQANVVWGILLLGSSLALTNAAVAAEVGKIYIGGKWVTAQKSSGINVSSQTNIFGLGGGVDLRKIAVDFLKGNSALLHLDGSSTWDMPAVQKGDELETHRVAKFWQGLPVVGGEALVHFNNGQFAFANADDTDLSHLSSKARVSAEEAKSIAFASYAGSAVSTDQPKLKVLLVPNGESREGRLVYEVTVRDRDSLSSDIHFIDADRGEELMVTSNVQTLAPRVVMAAEGTSADMDFEEDGWKMIYTSQGGCSRVNAEAPQSGFFSDWWSRSSKPAVASVSDPSACQNADPRVMASAIAAWNNSGNVESYYQNTHRRNSIDDRGMTLRSIVNFGGEQFQNAAWFNDKKSMLYGYGDSTKYNDFALPLDVAAHEFTHGVTSSTANLAYASESGALNESYSDVFGKLIAFKSGKPQNWKIGAELFRDGVGFIRDMENPTVGHYDNMLYRGQPCMRLNDFCGVHKNSGIPSRAAVLIANSLGLEKLGKLYYLTLTQLIRSNSTFHDARAQTEAACTSLFGAGSADCRAVSAAFETVGVR